MSHIIRGKIVDGFRRSIYAAEICIDGERISGIQPLPEQDNDPTIPYILPGFTDSHIHIESSMLVPSQFARLAVVHGTVATVSDPHEIANVCGTEGVEFMIRNGATVPLKFNFGAPSCVPATMFETAGASLDSAAVEKLLDRPEIKYLSEMMNFPGALHGDQEVMKKIHAAVSRNKPVDGHAPGLRGEEARQYIERGISTDHECFTAEEALDKLNYGMKIIIREGSAAKNFEALIPLLKDYPDNMMFCSDDKHPDSLVEGHINQLCARAVARGIPLFDVIKAACINPVLHYKLDVGLLRETDYADLIVVEDLQEFRVKETWINGVCVARNGIALFEVPEETTAINQFHCSRKTPGDFSSPVTTEDSIYPYPVIAALDGQLITNSIRLQPLVENGNWVSNLKDDVLKIAVVNRYREAPAAIAFIRNFGLRQGAIASSVAHDSHNIVAVGTDDQSICDAVNLVIGSEGGVSCVKDNLEMLLPLPVGGLMSSDDGYRVAELYTLIDKAAKEAGSALTSPFMTLSFMALLVIPHLKLSDQGLFNGDSFTFESRS